MVTEGSATTLSGINDKLFGREELKERRVYFRSLLLLLLVNDSVTLALR